MNRQAAIAWLRSMGRNASARQWVFYLEAATHAVRAYIEAKELELRKR